MLKGKGEQIHDVPEVVGLERRSDLRVHDDHNNVSPTTGIFNKLSWSLSCGPMASGLV